MTSLVDIGVGPDGKPVPLTIICKKAATEEELLDNIRVNIGRDVLRFMSLPGLLHARAEPLAIVAGGPSVDQYINEIRKFNQVMVCGSAHDHLVGLGITPSFAIAVDPAEDAVRWFGKPQKNCSYLLASQCHPSMFDNLKDHERLAMWHFKGQVDDESVFNGEPQINWGCMIGVHSIQMALFLGFQQLHFFGFDCCYMDDRHHAYDVGKYHDYVEENRQLYELNGRIFHSTNAFMVQMEHLFSIFESSDGRFIKGTVYGDGLWASVIRNSPPEMAQWLETR